MDLKFCIIFVVFQTCWANFTDKEYASLPPIFHQDNFDNCMLLEDDALYCSFEFHLKPTFDNNPIWKTIQELSLDEYNYKHENLRMWICVPLFCNNTAKKWKELTELELKNAINECNDQKIASYGLRGHVHNLKCETNKSKYPVDWLDKIALLFFTTYIAFVFSCTMCHWLGNSKSSEDIDNHTNSRWKTTVQSFSLIKNWNRLKSVQNTFDAEYLKPIQGVRFFNTILIVLSHTALSFTMLPVINTKYVETMNSKIGNMFLSSGPLCVSTFFLMSSTLLTYAIFTQFENKKLSKKVLVTIFVNRYLRLVPAFAVTLLFNVTWWRHLGSGPNWNYTIGREYSRCRNNWWINLLFVNTIVDSRNMCSPSSWYLALDTQYYVLILVLLWYIKKYEKYFWYIQGTLLTVNIVGTFIQNYIDDLEALVIPRAESVYEMKMLVGNPQWHRQMLSPIGNTAGPLLGICFGYLIFKTKNMALFQKNKLLWTLVFTVFSYGPALGIIVLPGWYVLVYQRRHDPLVASIIAAVGRPVFLISVGNGIFGCIHKAGGITESVLRWNPGYILGRISYSSYLVHATIIFSRAASTRAPVYVSDAHFIYYFLADFTAAYLIGSMLTLFVEMPVSALQKILISTHTRETVIVKKEK